MGGGNSFERRAGRTALADHAAFLRISTSRALQGRRFTIDEAAQIITQWVDQPNVHMLAPGEGHWHLLREMLTDGQAAGPL